MQAAHDHQSPSIAYDVERLSTATGSGDEVARPDQLDDAFVSDFDITRVEFVADFGTLLQCARERRIGRTISTEAVGRRRRSERDGELLDDHFGRARAELDIERL